MVRELDSRDKPVSRWIKALLQKTVGGIDRKLGIPITQQSLLRRRHGNRSAATTYRQKLFDVFNTYYLYIRDKFIWIYVFHF